ncbi:MAG: TlyA family RNA methyltransferase [bacterium]|nr:TlyA family RNA methyltransferase [bacterium]
MKKGRFRIDQRLVELNLAEDTAKAKAMLMAGEVFVNTKRIGQAGALVSAEDCVEVHSRSLPFASRGGFKLQKALDEFQYDVTGLTAADIGASTGGFTDCLLQRGAALVYAIDVGYGQLAPRLRQDPRVVVRDRTNARHLKPEDFSAPLQLITADASFIALSMLLPTLRSLLAEQGWLIALIKPQFEAKPEEVAQGGVVRDVRTHSRILHNLQKQAGNIGFPLVQLTYSPIKGPAGNIEFLAAFCNCNHLPSVSSEKIAETVTNAHLELD